MSKEQTPITAKEFLKSVGKNSYTMDIPKLMEQYAQAKVLEALEKLFDATQRTDFWVKYEGLEDWIEKELIQK